MKARALLALAFILFGGAAFAKNEPVREPLSVSRYHGTLVGSDYIAELAIVYGDIELVGERSLVRRLRRDANRKARVYAWIKRMVWQKIEATPATERIGERAYSLASTSDLRAIYAEVTLEVIPSKFMMCEAQLFVRPTDDEDDEEWEDELVRAGRVAFLPAFKLP